MATVCEEKGRGRHTMNGLCRQPVWLCKTNDDDERKAEVSHELRSPSGDLPPLTESVSINRVALPWDRGRCTASRTDLAAHAATGSRRRPPGNIHPDRRRRGADDPRRLPASSLACGQRLKTPKIRPQHIRNRLSRHHERNQFMLQPVHRVPQRFTLSLFMAVALLLCRQVSAQITPADYAGLTSADYLGEVEELAALTEQPIFTEGPAVAADGTLTQPLAAPAKLSTPAPASTSSRRPAGCWHSARRLKTQSPTVASAEPTDAPCTSPADHDCCRSAHGFPELRCRGSDRRSLLPAVATKRTPCCDGFCTTAGLCGTS